MGNSSKLLLAGKCELYHLLLNMFYVNDYNEGEFNYLSREMKRVGAGSQSVLIYVWLSILHFILH